MPGTLGLVGSAGGGLQLANQQFPQLARSLNLAPETLGRIGQGIGTAAGIGSGAYSLAQGNEEAGAMQIAQSLATFVAPPLAIPGVIAAAVENIVNAALGEGAYGQTPLPFTGRGVGNNWLSSADNAASQISAMTGLKGATQLQGVIQSATDPGQLLGLALAGPGLSPHGEVQFYMVGPNGETLSGGKGGVQQTPTNAAYEALVRRAAQNDPQALRDFISRVRIQSGESGAAKDDYLLTDWYRRKLVSLLPETHPVRQDVAGLFEPTPANQLPEARANAYLQAVNQM